MAKSKVKTGDIIKIPLCHNLGFAFVRYFDLTNIPNTIFPSLIKIFNYWAKSDVFNVEEIQYSNYLIQPMLVAGINTVLKDKTWEIIGYSEVSENELKDLPHFKTYHPLWEPVNNATEWFYVIDCDSNKKIKAAYDKVKHLSSYGGIATGNIEVIITMQLIKKEGLNIEDYFDLNDETFSYQFNNIKQSPLLIELPEEMHGKALK